MVMLRRKLHVLASRWLAGCFSALIEPKLQELLSTYLTYLHSERVWLVLYFSRAVLYMVVSSWSIMGGVCM